MSETKIIRGWISRHIATSDHAVTGAFRTDRPPASGGYEATLAITLPSRKKSVWQWRYKNAEQKHWKLAKTLLTREEAAEYFLGCDIEPHGPAVEVTCED